MSRKNTLVKWEALAMTGVLSLSGVMPAMAAEDYSPIYTSEYASKAEALQAGLELNERISEEGIILMKNENNVLPLAENAKVTLLGHAAVAPNAGGSLNGGDASGGISIAQATVISSLESAGYQLNQHVLDCYNKWDTEAVPGTEEEENPTMKSTDVLVAEDFAAASETDEWKTSIGEYADAALVVISGGTGEISAEGRVHALQLDQAQLDLIDYAAANFEKVIVLVNSCTALELKAVQDNEAVDAIVNIGEPGDNGFDALGKVLKGEVTPSGRTVDTWAADFTQNPSYTIFNTSTSSSGQGEDGNGTLTGYTQYSVDGNLVNTWSVGYEEGIYVGYRYYETRSFEENKAEGAQEDAWWNENVVYPFGYGLSYTTFDWEVAPATEAGSAVTKDDQLVFDVTVTNTGDYAGKDVVQLYYTAPYGVEETGNDTVIEKAYVVLGDFAKTDVLEPGESQTVQLVVDAADMASYDEVTDKTYVLDAGTYNVKIADSAHYGLSEKDADFDYTVEEKQLCNEAVTGAEITNALDDVTEGFANEGYTSLSRSDFESTMPNGFEQVKEISADEYATWAYDDADYDAYYDAETIGTVVYEEDAANRESDKYSIVLSDLIGAEADDPRYQELVEQLTLEELVDMVNFGGFNTHGIPYIGKPYARDTDGPKGWTGNYTDANDRFNYFASEPMIAATFNEDLLYEMGTIVGDQGLWGNSTVESGAVYSYTGWYGPGMNIHRSPFDSRVTEYYSEDPFLTGALASSVSHGAQSKGGYITLKHFAFHNDGGGASTYRFGVFGDEGTANDGLSAWMTEQTAREVYLKGYQMAVEDGNATFAMGSFTRIGKVWCSGSYAINSVITRGEWGFDGAIITDIAIYEACNAYQLIKSGANLMLDASVYGMSDGVYLDADEILAMDETERNITIYCLQQAVKDVLYMVANSNAMQIPAGAKVVFGDVTAEAGTVGQEYTSEQVATAALNTYYPYSTINYTVEGLPEGLTFDAENGVITGTPEAAGEYEITITAEAEGYETAVATTNLEIGE